VSVIYHQLNEDEGEDEDEDEDDEDWFSIHMPFTRLYPVTQVTQSVSELHSIQIEGQNWHPHPCR